MLNASNVSLPVPETKSLLGSPMDRKVSSASWRDLAKYGVIHFGKAALAQGIAFAHPMLLRSLAQEIYRGYSDSEMSPTASLAITGGCVLLTLAFDQLCTANTIHKMRSWLGTKDGVPGRPSTSASQALALLPTALAGSLVVSDWHGDGNQYAVAVLVAVDMGAMVAGWRAGRLARDTLQQGMSSCLPTLKIVDMDSGEELTPLQKRTFDDSRLGWQTALYTGVVFVGAFVTVPALRLYMGKDEYVESWTMRLLAMAAPAINSMLVEGTDELISVFVQSKIASRQGLAVQVVPGKPKEDWVEQAMDHGGLRALMGALVTDVAQLISSADRNMDIVTVLSTAVSSLAIALMEIRGKSVTVHQDHAKNSEAFNQLVDQLIITVEAQTNVALPRDEIHERLNTLAKGIYEPQGSHRPFKTMGMVLQLDSKDPVWVGDGKQTPLTADEKAGLGTLQQSKRYAQLEGGKAYFMKKGAGGPAQVADTKLPAGSAAHPGQATSLVPAEEPLKPDSFATPTRFKASDGVVRFTKAKKVEKVEEGTLSIAMEREGAEQSDPVRPAEPKSGIPDAKPPSDLTLASGLVLEQAQIVDTDPEDQAWTVRVSASQDTGLLEVVQFGSDGFKQVKVPKDLQAVSLSQ